jgi:hypothetical protein
MNDISPNLSQSFETAPTPPNSNEPVVKHQKTGIGLLGTVLVSVFMIMAIYGGYQIYTVYKTTSLIEQSKITLEDLKTSNITDNQSVNLQVKSNFLAEKRKNQIFWTNAIFNIESSIPNPSNFDINSIAGTENGTVNINLSTSAQSSDPFTDTASLISVFKTKNFFDAIFIPSISSVVDDTGVGKLSYTLRLDYKKEATEKKAIQASELTPSNPTDSATPETSTPTDPSVVEELRQRLATPPTTPETPAQTEPTVPQTPNQ